LEEQKRSSIGKEDKKLCLKNGNEEDHIDHSDDGETERIDDQSTVKIKKKRKVEKKIIWK
jgi:hypothetical protein